MIRKIVIWPNEQLHSVSAPVTSFNGIKELVADMFETMYAAGGIGLSAIQIGVPLRVFVMETGDGKEFVFVNPEHPKLLGIPEERNEGCLSVPGVVEQVLRYPGVEIKATDREGKLFEAKFTSIQAQCVQHEYEHLRGIVMPDKLTATARERLRKVFTGRKA